MALARGMVTSCNVGLTYFPSEPGCSPDRRRLRLHSRRKPEKHEGRRRPGKREERQQRRASVRPAESASTLRQRSQQRERYRLAVHAERRCSYRGHGEHHINSSRNCHVEDLAPSPESTPDYGPDGNAQQDQKGEGGEQWGMSARRCAYCYDGLRPPNDLETLP